VEWYANDGYGGAFRALITVCASARASAETKVIDAVTTAVALSAPAQY
jgi:hypothetical protein